MPPVYYPAVIDRSASGFGVSFPDFPGCIAAGATVQEAAVNAEAALAMHLDGMRADKDAIPQPSSLDAIEDVEGADDLARVMVRAELPGQFTRIQVTIENGVLAAIDAVATNRSAFLTDAARAALNAAHAAAPSRLTKSLRSAATKARAERVSSAAQRGT
jgi:predicted RNase H-like HicB family nuclease